MQTNVLTGHPEDVQSLNAGLKNEKVTQELISKYLSPEEDFALDEIARALSSFAFVQWELAIEDNINHSFQRVLKWMEPSGYAAMGRCDALIDYIESEINTTCEVQRWSFDCIQSLRNAIAMYRAKSIEA